MGTYGDVLAPHDGMRQRVPKLHDAIETGCEKLAYSRMWTQRPQLVGVSHDGWAEAHRQGADQNAIAGRSDKQLWSTTLRHGTDTAQMFGYLYEKTILTLSIHRLNRVNDKSRHKLINQRIAQCIGLNLYNIIYLLFQTSIKSVIKARKVKIIITNIFVKMSNKKKRSNLHVGWTLDWNAEGNFYASNYNFRHSYCI